MDDSSQVNRAAPAPLAEFGRLVRLYRQRAGLSQNRLARVSGVDPAYVNRIEAALAHSPLVPRPAVLARLADGLGLAAADRDRLYFAAGRLPPSLALLDAWDPALALVAEFLRDQSLEADDRAEFRQVLSILVDRFGRSSGDPRRR